MASYSPMCRLAGWLLFGLYVLQMKRPPCGGLFALSLSQPNDTAKGLYAAIIAGSMACHPAADQLVAPGISGHRFGLWHRVLRRAMRFYVSALWPEAEQDEERLRGEVNAALAQSASAPKL